MLFNYLKIAFRNLSRNKVYSLINILGLSLGIGCCLMLSLYIQDEMSYDKHQKRLPDLYRIITEFEIEQGFNEMTSTSPPIAMSMRNEIPEVESAVRIINPPGVSRNLIKYEDKMFYETNGFIADSTLFEVFTYNLLQGNSRNALAEANSVVISEELAHKLFGDGMALDKVINISQGREATDFKITGVFREEGKSFLKANFFTSMTTAVGMAEYLTSDEAEGEWVGQNFVPSYLKLIPGHNKDEVIKKMNAVLMKHAADDLKAMGRKKSLRLEPVGDIYLRSGINQSPRITYLYIIATIAVFILLIACINFMNLSTAKATRRAAEIGIRKVMGAVRGSLIRQILGEAMIIVLISILISIILVQAGLPLFNELTGKSISFSTQNIMFFIFALSGIAIVTGVVAGSYPAFYLSGFQPAEVLKGKFKMSNSSGWLRRSLVVFQFMIAITLVCSMLIISDQLTFMQNEDLGFDSHAKIVLPLRTDNARQSYDELLHELQKQSSIKQVAGTDYIPGSPIWSDSFFFPDGGQNETAVDIRRVQVDHGYTELMNIKLIAGRSFGDNRKPESDYKIMINRVAAENLGFNPQEAVGQFINNDWHGDKTRWEIIGVIENYHHTDLKEKIFPTLFQMADTTIQYQFMIANVQTGNFNETLSAIEKTWKEQVSDTPFEYTFLDENITRQYDEDRRISRIISSFTLIAMLISCLGLYGLSSYMAERRFKEIGIRKVMGANINQIVGMMSKEFLKLVLIAFIISVPLAWYAMNQWLEGFAYKIPINPLLFVWAGFAALMIALVTVSFESIKAAIVNPVKSLRNE